ncbi:hypothetical protein [Levilactobacillus brevis]|uniref:hypothetical protein n=1 Tax=Levilactobacillus brevis TaxID=1580 RepID=UPI000467DDF6
MDVIQERLEREFNLDLITTAPSVTYHAYLTDGTMKEVENPAECQRRPRLNELKRPIVKATIMAPNDYVGAVMDLWPTQTGTILDDGVPG